MIKISEKYKPRSIRFLDYWSIGSWKMKAYGISYANEFPNKKLIQSAKEVTAARLLHNSKNSKHYNVGFVGIHEGKDENFVYIDWWAEENELYHHIYTSTISNPERLEYKTPTGLAACVWDLALIRYEREAWVT
ncbi:MAG: hypothetical protein P8X42_01150, partial [Calditrichaceae bacterium]